LPGRWNASIWLNGRQVALAPESPQSGQFSEWGCHWMGLNWTFHLSPGAGRNWQASVSAGIFAGGLFLSLCLAALVYSVRAGEESQKKLQRTENTYRQLVDAVQDYAIFMLDPAGKVVSWNLGAQRLKGYTAGEILGRHFSCFYPPDVVAAGHPAWELEIAAAEGFYREEGLRLRKDGTSFQASVVLSAIRGPEGTLIGYAKVTRDLSDVLAAEQQKQELARIVEETDAAVLIRELDGRITYWNQGAQRLYGWTAAEAAGIDEQTLIHTRLSSPRDEMQARCLADGRWQGELERVSKTGLRLTVAAIWTTRQSSPGAHPTILEISHDVTERIRNEQRFRAVVEAAPNALLMASPDDRIVQCNAQAENLFGYSRAELLSLSVEQLLPTRFREAHRRSRHSYLASAQVRRIGAGRELYALHRDGREIPVEIDLSPVATADGNFVLAAVIDITARRENEIRLATYAQRLHLATAVLKAGVWDWDVNTNAVQWDQRMYAMYGHSPDLQPTYALWASSVIPEDLPAAEAALRAILDSKLPGSFDFRIRRPDGICRRIHAAATAIAGENGAVVRLVGANLDVTEQELSRALERQRSAELKAANQELEDFAYAASHDLKAPLRVIENASKWLEEDLQEHLTEETRESMQLLRGRVKRMDKLLDDLLLYARIGRARQARPPDTVAGAEITDEILKLLPLNGFAVHVAPEFASIRVARMPLQQVLMNLVSNAMRHHDRPSGTVELHVASSGRFYEFSVTDDGPGIPPEFQEKVFKMFQTLKPRDQVEGSGMGLALVRKHVSVAGGEIHVESHGRGCTFRFTWPKPEPSPEPSGDLPS
jgi:PAS domain S-box-containing protein